MLKAAWMVTLVLFAGSIAAGCGREKAPDENQIKIMYYGTERQFFSEYGDYFAARFPELDVEVVSTGDIQPGIDTSKEYEKRMNAEKPDVVMLYSNSYAVLNKGGFFLDLNPLIRRNQFDIGNIAPAVIDHLSASGGDGKLYGLGTSFTSSVLLYNKDLFKRYGVPEPEGKLNWEQLYLLIRHFSVNDASRERVYGFHRPFLIHPFNYVQEIADSNGLSLVNMSTLQISINTEGWRKAFRLVADHILGGSLYAGSRTSKDRYEQDDIKNADLFRQGKAAMTIGNFVSVSGLVSKPPAFQWGIAGAPADRATAGMAQGMSMTSPIFTIYAKANHVETAWRVVQYLNSDEVARINSGLKTGVLPVRRKYAPDLAGHNPDIFYDASDSFRSISDYAQLPAAFREVMGSIVTEEFDTVLVGKATVDEALKRMQQREQAALDAAIAAEAK